MLLLRKYLRKKKGTLSEEGNEYRLAGRKGNSADTGQCNHVPVSLEAKNQLVSRMLLRCHTL